MRKVVVVGAMVASLGLSSACATEIGGGLGASDETGLPPDDDSAPPTALDDVGVSETTPLADTAKAPGDTSTDDVPATDSAEPHDGATADSFVDSSIAIDARDAADAPDAIASGCPDFHCTVGCSELIPFPGSFDPASAEAKAAGYYITTFKQYSYLRRHIVMLVQHAACEVMHRYPGTTPLALQDMSQADGHTPGTDVGAPRHPAGTHTGSDIDISYYQTDGANDNQIVCGDGSDTNPNGVPGRWNDGYFCTTTKNIVDWPRETWFFAKMADTPLVRVFGIDQTFPDSFRSAFASFLSAGLVDKAAYDRMSILGFGAAGGWQYHHHHSHMSFTLP